MAGSPYPAVIQNLIRRNIYKDGVCTNGGVGGETSAVIASRTGAYIEFVDANGNTVKRDYRLRLAASVTIPASGSVVVDLAEVTEFNDREGILRQGAGNSINPMYIVDDQGNKIEGSLKVTVKAGESGGTTAYENLTYTFTRTTAGTATTASAGNRVELYGETAYDGRIQVIYAGQNGGYNGDVKELYYQQLAMLYATGTVELNEDKTLKLGEDGAPVGNYVIVGLHSGNASNRASMEAAMKE